MHSFNLRQALVTEATPDYSANDLCGGKVAFNITQAARGSKLTRLAMRSKDTFAGVASKVMLFNADPTATTFTENGAFSINAADLTKQLAVVRIAAADWIDDTGVGGGYYVEKELLIPLSVIPIVYAAFIPAATLNLSATDSLQMWLGGERD